MLNLKTDLYAISNFAEDKVRRGFYFPDSVLNELKQVIENITKTENLATDIQSSPVIPLDTSKHLIIDALKQFDSDLGLKAEEILNDPKRLNIHSVPSGEGVMMRNRAAFLSLEQVKSDGMEIPNGPLKDRFPQDDNPEGFSIIDFEFDSTIYSIVYLAHELGHAIADDYQNEAGNKNSQNPMHMEETQAYFIQHIVTSALINNKNPQIASATKSLLSQELEQYKEELQRAFLQGDNVRLHERPTAYILGSIISQNLLSHNPSSRKMVSETLLGRYGIANISQTLAKMGVERSADFSQAIREGFDETLPNNNRGNIYTLSLRQNTPALMT